MKNLIQSLDSSYTDSADGLIVDQILNWDIYKNANTVFTFITIGREINTVPIILDALTKEKTVCIPKCYPNAQMEARKISAISDINTKNDWEVPEPGESSLMIEKNQIDLALVPCLAADRSGYRLGYGTGYYDAYLRTFPGIAVILCRERQMVDKIPIEDHDAKTGLYVTENGIFAPKA